MTQLLDQLKRHEGYREHVYKCTAGFNTIGYGYNLDSNSLKLTSFELIQFKEKGISEATANYLLMRCIDEVRKTLLVKIEGFADLDPVRADCLINMAFNLGVHGLLGFYHTLDLIKLKQFSAAAQAMLKSKWAAQVHGRAEELAKQMETGEYA